MAKSLCIRITGKYSPCYLKKLGTEWQHYRSQRSVEHAIVTVSVTYSVAIRYLVSGEMWRVPVIIMQSDVVTSAFFPDLGEKTKKMA